MTDARATFSSCHICYLYNLDQGLTKPKLEENVSYRLLDVPATCDPIKM